MFFEGKEQSSSIRCKCLQVDKVISNFYKIMPSHINATLKTS